MAPRDKKVDTGLPLIYEIIIVEGRDDTAAIKRAVRAVTIETHGFGISKSTWTKIENAYKEKGIIIFTDPDHAGEEIRKRILERFPDAKQAFLTKEKAKEKRKSSLEKTMPDIGIENASPKDIREALEKAHASVRGSGGAAPQLDGAGSNREEQSGEFTTTDLDQAGLVGGAGSKERRENLGDILGIGYSNAKTLLYKLNTLGIERDTFEEAVKKLQN